MFLKRKTQIHTLSWPDSDPSIFSSQKLVMDHFGFYVRHSHVQQDHGAWMDEIMRTEKAEVVGFIDSDCVPVHASAVYSAIDYARSNVSFIGLAQAANHIPPAKHVYAAPAFFFIHVDAYEKLGRPSFCADKSNDVAQNISRKADEIGMRYNVCCLHTSRYRRTKGFGRYRILQCMVLAPSMRAASFISFRADTNNTSIFFATNAVASFKIASRQLKN